MRALILHTPDKGMAELSEGIAGGLRATGHDVTVMKITPGSDIVSVYPYKLVCVGASVEGFFGGKISPLVSEFLKRCPQLAGKKTAAFSIAKLIGTDKAMRVLMGMLESNGAFVIHFMSFGGIGDIGRAREFGKQLGKMEY